MATRRPFLVVLAGLFALPASAWAASHRTPNFVIDAPTPQVAQQIGQYAEHWRKEKALQWLGKEMPNWGQPLPLKVTVTQGGAGGATSFAFDNGRILHQEMHIEGSLERLLNSVLPHEVTHTVFAYHFRCPLPRWADEGGAVLSEDDIERDRHDRLVRQILNQGRAIPLRRLLMLKEYPQEVMALYAQGFSVCNFLVNKSSKPDFLNFIADGMRRGWDAALQQHYQIRSVEELEQQWLAHLRATKRGQPTMLASNTPPAPAAAPAGQVVVRQTAPPVQPFDDLPRPVFRGVAPEGDGQLQAQGRPNYLPEYVPPRRPGDGWQAAPQRPAAPPSVQLMAPQFEAPPPAQLGQPIPGPASPVGYPR